MSGVYFAWNLLNRSNPFARRFTGSSGRGGRSRREPLRRRLAVETLEARTLPSFAAPSSYLFSGGVDAVAAADFTHHGIQDLVVASGTIAGTLTLLVGNGDGTFRNGGAIPHAGGLLAVGDFTGDGLPDLAVGHQQDVEILLNNGDGTFRDAGFLDGGRIITALAVGDFFGDGHQDIVTVSVVDGAMLLRGNGNGTFQQPVSIPALRDGDLLVAADLDNTGRDDLIAGNFRDGARLLASNGDGTFQASVPFAPGFPLAVTDLNGDGIADLVLPTPQGIAERLGNGDGTFQDPIPVNLPANAVNNILAVGDFNHDGLLDVVTRSGGSSLSVLLNNGAGSFTGAPAYAVGRFPTAIAAGDFNGDGLPDLVSVGYDSQAHVLLDNGDGTFQSGATLPIAGIGTSVATGDFTGTGNIGFATIAYDQSSGDSLVNVFLGNGDGTFQTGQVIDLGAGTATGKGRIVAGDFTGSHRLDLAVLYHDYSSRGIVVEVFPNNGDGTFRATEPEFVDNVTGLEASGLAAADIYRDGKLDLIVTRTNLAEQPGGVVFLLHGNGDGTFQAPTSIPLREDPFQVAVGDFNGDGIPDLVLSTATTTFEGITNTVSVLLGNGDGTFRAPVDYPVAAPSGVLVVGPFHGNGVLDVAVALSNTVSILRGNGDGTFGPAVSYLVGRGPDALAVGDFNGDGSLDLAVANFNSNDVSVLLNSGGGDSPGGRHGGSGKTDHGGFTDGGLSWGKERLPNLAQSPSIVTGPADSRVPGREQEAWDQGQADAFWTAAAALFRPRHSLDGSGDGTFPLLVEE